MQGEMATGDPSCASGAAEGRREICVFINRRSGKREGGRRAAEIEAVFRSLSLDCVIRQPRRGSEIPKAAARAVQEGFRTIVAAGGDGTVAAVAAGVAGSDCRMGVIPLGTFNYFARAHGLPETVPEAVRAIASGTVRPIDIGEVNGRVFINNASIGAYAKVLENRERVYRRWGRSRAAAYWSVLVALVRFRARLSAKVTVDGEEHSFKTPMIFVACNAFQLELFRLSGADVIRSGNLAVLVAPDCGRFGLLRFALRLALGSMYRGRDFILLSGQDVLVETRRKGTVVARDGERGRMKAPFRFRLLRGGLDLITPSA